MHPGVVPDTALQWRLVAAAAVEDGAAAIVVRCRLALPPQQEPLRQPLKPRRRHRQHGLQQLLLPIAGDVLVGPIDVDRNVVTFGLAPRPPTAACSASP